MRSTTLLLPTLVLLLAACATPSATVANRPAAGRPPLPAPPARLEPSLVPPAAGAAVLADTTTAPLRAPAVLESATGQATYYADLFEGRLTASGVPYRARDMIAAHRTYPFGTVLRVTNLENGRAVIVRVFDRGPWGTSQRQRATIVDLSRAAAERLDYIRDGRVAVRVDVLEWGDRGG